MRLLCTDFCQISLFVVLRGTGVVFASSRFCLIRLFVGKIQELARVWIRSTRDKIFAEQFSRVDSLRRVGASQFEMFCTGLWWCTLTHPHAHTLAHITHTHAHNLTHTRNSSTYHTLSAPPRNAVCVLCFVCVTDLISLCM